MADKKISELTALTSPADADEIEIIDKSDNSMAASGTNKKITAVNLIPDATETIKGKAELATDTEAQTGTDTTRIVTPANLMSVVETGWIVADAMTYVSTTTFSVVGDQTAKYHKGAKVKMTNNGSVKTFYVSTSVYSTVTTVTVAGEVLLVSGAITLPFYSYADCPQGFKRGEDWYFVTSEVTSQSIATSSIVTAQLVESYDPNNNFTAYQYTVPITGLYSVDAQSHFATADVVANQRYSHIVFGTGVSNVWISQSPGGANTVGHSSAEKAYLIKGDVIYLSIYHTAGATKTMHTATMSIQFIGV